MKASRCLDIVHAVKNNSFIRLSAILLPCCKIHHEPAHEMIEKTAFVAHVLAASGHSLHGRIFDKLTNPCVRLLQ